MSDRTASNANYEIVEEPLTKPGFADADAVPSEDLGDDAGLSEDQAIHLLLTAWTLVLEEEQQRR
jgi:hypothetical protein